MPSVGSPLMRTMMSPALNPACAAGVSSIGEITTQAVVVAVDLDADAGELALAVGDHLLIFALVEIVGMRIEAGQHPLQAVDHQLLVLDRHDIVGFDAVHHPLHQGEVGGGRGSLAVGRRLGGTGRQGQKAGRQHGRQNGGSGEAHQDTRRFAYRYHGTETVRITSFGAANQRARAAVTRPRHIPGSATRRECRTGHGAAGSWPR